MTMTIDELIERLEDYRDELGSDCEVRLMTQQNWPFKPVEAIDYHSFKFVGFGLQIDEGRDNLGMRCGDRKSIAVDLIETVLGLDENRTRRFGRETAFSDAFDTVQQQPGGPRSAASLNASQRAHQGFSCVFEGMSGQSWIDGVGQSSSISSSSKLPCASISSSQCR
jgi:hypothetical protein